MTRPARARPAAWPTPAETDLLRAALWAGDEARAAYAAWRVALALDDVRGGSLRVLPALYRNLDRLGGDAPEMGRLGGIARKAWVETQLWLPRLSAALAVLEAAQVPAAVLSGVALAAYYPDGPNGRSTDDHELWVPAAQAEAALAALSEAGWRPAITPLHPPQQWRAPVRCVAVDGQFVDVQAQLAWEVSDRAGVDWQAATTTAALGEKTLRVLAPAEQLLAVCVVGARGNSTAAVRWAADAWHLLRAPALDWERLTALAAEWRVEPPVSSALTFLRDELRAAISERVFEALRARPLSPRERRFFELNAQPRGQAGELPVLWADYQRRVERGTATAGPLGWLNFLRAAWNRAHVWQLPGHALRRLIRRASQPTPAP